MESGPRERPPGRFAHVGRRRDEPLLHASVARNCGQCTTPPDLVCVEDQLAVGRDARRFVARSGRQHLHLPRREILRRDLEAAAVAAHERKALAVGKRPRRDVVAAVEREPLDGVAAQRQAVDLRTAAAIGREQQRLAVGHEHALRCRCPGELITRCGLLPSAFIR